MPIMPESGKLTQDPDPCRGNKKKDVYSLQMS